MGVSREVDLTRHLDFKDNDKKLRSINLKSVNRDYKRYHRMKAPSTTTASFNDFDINDTVNATRTINSIFDSLLHRDIVYVEEKICWRKLIDDPDIFSQHYTQKEWEERIKNWNFPLGSKYDRMKTHYEKLREAERQLADTCDCCGQKLNYNNCLAHHYAMCQKCLENLCNRIETVSLR